jgi:alkylation response protein AidB-like acyl-CoA dehydrogenase
LLSPRITPAAQGGKRIVEYSDVKRMLLQQKAYTEGGFALAMHAATLYQRKVRCAGKRR